MEYLLNILFVLFVSAFNWRLAILYHSKRVNNHMVWEEVELFVQFLRKVELLPKPLTIKRECQGKKSEQNWS